MAKFTTVMHYEYIDGDGDEYLVNPFYDNSEDAFISLTYNGELILMTDDAAGIVVEMLQQALADRVGRKKK